MKTIAITCVATLLVSCTGNSTNSDPTYVDSDASSEPVIFLDSNTTLPESVQAFRNIKLSPVTATDVLKAEIRYVDTNSDKSVSQRAYRSDASVPFSILVPPFNIDQDTLVNIYLDTANNNQFLGTLTIAALPELAELSNPGEYSLHGMNAILKELNSAISIKTIGYNANKQESDATSEQWLNTLSEFSDNFQAIINLSTDAVVFNSPITNPVTNASVIDQKGFEMMDRIYLALSQRLVNRGILFDGNDLANGEIDNPQLADSFSLFAHAVEDFVATEEGMQALSSLNINAEKTSNSEDLTATLDIFRATLMPSLVTQMLTNYSGDLTLPSVAAREQFYLLTNIISTENEDDNEHNFILKNAFDTLLWLKATMKLYP